MSFSASSTVAPSAFADAMALVRAAADPKGTQDALARLSEASATLTAQQEDMKSREAALATRAADVEAHAAANEAREAELADRERKLKDAQDTIMVRASALSAREADVRDRSDALKLAEQEMAGARQALAAQAADLISDTNKAQAALALREKAVAAKEVSVSKRLAALRALATEEDPA